MAVEHGHRGQRGLYASWVQAGVPAGLLLATAVFNVCSLLPEEQFLQWGWRVPFLLGILLLAVGMFIRLRVLESPLFARLQAKGRSARVPLVTVLRRYPRNVLLAMGGEKPAVDGSLRFSLGATTTSADVAQACERILQVVKDLRSKI